MSWGHFSRERGRVRGSHYRYFLPISQQKAGKRNFGEKKLNNEDAKTQREAEQADNRRQKNRLLKNYVFQLAN